MLDKFPGLLNYGEIIAIHADWPTYPNGLGWELALMSLGNYSKETNFYEISHIDKCLLFVNQVPATLNNKYDYKLFHTAIWETDLLDLSKMNLVIGAKETSKYGYDKFYFDCHKNIMKAEFPEEAKDQFPEDAQGNIITAIEINGEIIKHVIKNPIPEDYEEEDLDEAGYIIVPERLSIFNEGWEKIKEISQYIDWHHDIKNLVAPLLSIQRFDTAIREAALLVETSIKIFHNCNLFGATLIDHHLNDIIKHNDNYFSAALKYYRGELRTLFKFIRNDFAHNFRVLTEEQCKMILYRTSKVYMEFLEVKQVYYSK